jgi:hypothetical protein
MKGFDWDTFATDGEVVNGEVEELKPKPMHRQYAGSDRRVCDWCGIQGDVHYIRNHFPYCKKNPDNMQQPKAEGEADTDKEQTQL